ncbi:MAG: hypothetical protein LBN71_05100, partial [Tannerella sp.]|nr:hypothetical protein [Tannerella sp.]
GCRFTGFITPEGIILDQYDLLAKTSRGHFSLVDFGSYIEPRIKKVDREKLSPESLKKLVKLESMIAEEDDDCSLLFRGKFIQ